MNIVFIGNCHTFSVMGLVQRALQDPELNCRYFWRAENGAETIAAARAADRIVYHVTDYEPNDAVKEVIDAAGDRVVRLPYIAGNFLWPFATRPHPRNKGAISYFLGSGPYEPQFSDTELLKLMSAHTGEPAEDIVDRFLELDFNAIKPLDRYYEFNRHKYTRLGQSCGLDLWPVVDKYLVDHRPFYTCFHPSNLLLKPVARFALEQLGIPGAKINEVLEGFEPFVGGQMPIHPSVIRHFGLKAVGEDTRYVYFPAGHFTAREYFIRFVNFTYDAELHQAVYDFASSGKVAEAVPVITQRLELRPDNPDLWNQLAFAQHRLGRPTEAARCAIRALALEPTRYEFQSAFRHLVDPDRIGSEAWPRLPLGQTFTLGDPSSPALTGLRAGWSHPEGWGVWGVGGELRLTYPLEQTNLAPDDEFVSVDLLISPALCGPDHQLSVDVFAEDRLVVQWQFDAKNVQAPGVECHIRACPIQRVNGEPILSLLFRVTGYASPASHGLSNDERNLSLGLKSIAIHPPLPTTRNDSHAPIVDREAIPAPDRHLVPAAGQPELETAGSTFRVGLWRLWRLGRGPLGRERAPADRRSALP